MSFETLGQTRKHNLHHVDDFDYMNAIKFANQMEVEICLQKFAKYFVEHLSLFDEMCSISREKVVNPRLKGAMKKMCKRERRMLDNQYYARKYPQKYLQAIDRLIKEKRFEEAMKKIHRIRILSKRAKYYMNLLGQARKCLSSEEYRPLYLSVPLFFGDRV